MFGHRFFPARYFTKRYWLPTGEDAGVVVGDLNASLTGGGRLAANLVGVGATEVAGGPVRAGGGFSRKRYYAVLDALDAERKARDRAKAFKRKDRRTALVAVANVNAAIRRARQVSAEVLAASKLKRATALIEGAAQAGALVEFLDQLQSAMQLLSMAMEDEDDVIALLLAA